MADAWRRFAAAYRLELRLLCLHWLYPLLHLLWAAFVYYGMRNQILGSAQAALEGNLGSMTLGIVSLAALFTGAASAARAQQTRFAALADSFPTGQEVVLGRWLATVTALMGAAIAPLAYAWSLGPSESFLAGAPTFLLDCLITFAFTSAGAWWLIDRLGMRRWVYPLVGAGWLGFLFTFELFMKDHLDVPAVLLLDFMHTTRPIYVEAWGRAMEGRLPLWFDLFYLGLAALFISATLWQTHSRRMHRHPMAAALAAALALGTAVTGAVGYMSEIGGREALRQDDMRALEAGTQRGRGAIAEAITAYTLTADLTTPTYPRFTAAITVANHGETPLDTIYLSLHRQFIITDVSLPHERAGHYLSVRPPQPLAPGASTEIMLAYEGRLSAVHKRFDGFPEIIFFTTNEGVRLSQAAGWYPLAGQQALVPDMTQLVAVPAAFDLTVTAPPEWGVFATLPATGDGRFAAPDATWAALLASPRLAVEQQGDTTLVAARAEMDLLRSMAVKYSGVAEHMAAFFPDLELAGLTLAMVDSADGYPYATPPAGQTALLIMDHSTTAGVVRHPEYEFGYIGVPLLRDFWHMSGGDIQMKYLHEIGTFLWSHYDTGGNAEAMKYAPNQRVAQILHDVYVAYGVTGVTRALTAVREDPSLLENHQMEAFASQVKGAATSAP